MSTRKLLVGGLAIFWITLSTHAQGTFVNLDFEAATIPATPVGGWAYSVDPSQALPGWIVGGFGTVVMYNTVSLGAPAISLIGPEFPNAVGYLPLEGFYSVYLQYFGIAGGPPSLSQTGLVPSGTRSISFLVPSGQGVAFAAATWLSLNGVNIPLVSIDEDRVAGDVSAFAGAVAQLSFATINSRDFLYIDDIQFSASLIPEPNAAPLLALGGVLWGILRRAIGRCV